MALPTSNQKRKVATALAQEAEERARQLMADVPACPVNVTKRVNYRPEEITILFKERNELHLILPLPPSANDYHVPFVMRQGSRNIPGLRLSTAAKNYKNAILHRLKEYNIEPTKRKLSVRYVAYLPDMRRDLVNVGKVLYDALEKSVYLNDRQIWEEGKNLRSLDPDNPRVEVFISYFEHPEDRGYEEEEELLGNWTDNGPVVVTDRPSEPSSKLDGLEFDMEDFD